MNETFIFRAEWLEIINLLDTEEQADILRMIIDYALTGECEDTYKPTVKVAFIAIRQSIDRSNAYSKSRSEAGKRGGRPSKITDTEETKEVSDEKSSEKVEKAELSVPFLDEKQNKAPIPNPNPIPNPIPEKEKVKREKAASRFSPPSLEEVTEYCRERGNRVDPSAFIDHYKSNNWMVGKNKMKDWKAAVRTWERRESEFRPQKQGRGHVSQTPSFAKSDLKAPAKVPEFKLRGE